MSSLVYPASLPGLTFDNVRTPMFNTGVQAALSGKESRIAYQQYPLMQFDLTYELLRDYVTPSDLKALVGLFIACKGKYDTFLYSDPTFNSVTSMLYGVGDGTTTSFATTATYQNTGGPGGAELIQNFNGVPVYELYRYGSSPMTEYMAGTSRTQYVLYSQDFTQSNWGKTNCTASVASQAAPDGTLTANVINNNTTSNVPHYVSQTFSGATAAGVYTGSLFAWAGPADGVYLYLQLIDVTTGDSLTAVFNRTNGTLVSTSSSGTWSAPVAAISIAGTQSGYTWYRFSISGTKSGAHACYMQALFSTSASSPVYAGTSGNACAVIWGAQFENAAVYPPIGGAYPTMYISTTSAGIARVDYTLGATGIVATSFTPALNWGLGWSGSFYYRCRFDDDSWGVTQFMNKFWSTKKVTLKQVKL